jgi:hypothetical protein
MGKFKRGTLHSGSKKGPIVKNRKQAISIMLSEKKSEEKTAKSTKGKIDTKPTKSFMKRFESK